MELRPLSTQMCLAHILSATATKPLQITLIVDLAMELLKVLRCIMIMIGTPLRGVMVLPKPTRSHLPGSHKHGQLGVQLLVHIVQPAIAQIRHLQIDFYSGTEV